MWKSIWLLAFWASGVSRAEEVDQFSNYGLQLNDSRPVLNAKVNALMTEAIRHSNQLSSGCDPSRLYSSLHHYFSFKNQFIGGIFNKWIVESPEVDRNELKISATIYGDFPFLEAPFFRLGHPDSRELRVGQIKIGTDKIDHFFSRGYKYFLAFKRAGGTSTALKALLQDGFRLESGLWGQIATGVFSYGDLAANFHGLRFWNDVLGQPTNSGDYFWVAQSQPYVACQRQRWVQLRNFDWSRYIDDAWDETVNCNLFAEKSLAAKIKERLADLSINNNVVFACPMHKERLERLYENYQRRGLAQYLVNGKGGVEVYRKNAMP